ncbi:MAG: hypothetical protein ACN6RK_10070 [Stenotrophomonas sp.]
MYLLILFAARRFNRLLFDMLSILWFIGLLMAFLASSGEAAMVIALIACIHLSLTFAGSRKQRRSSIKAHAPAESR